MLEIQAKEPDRFWISLAWSWDGLVPSVYRDLQGEVGARFNLGKLWNERNAFHYWELANVPERAMLSDEELMFALSEEGENARIAEGISRAPESVEDAIDRFIDNGLPYFESIRHTDSQQRK